MNHQLHVSPSGDSLWQWEPEEHQRSNAQPIYVDSNVTSPNPAIIKAPSGLVTPSAVSSTSTSTSTKQGKDYGICCEHGKRRKLVLLRALGSGLYVCQPEDPCQQPPMSALTTDQQLQVQSASQAAKHRVFSNVARSLSTASERSDPTPGSAFSQLSNSTMQLQPLYKSLPLLTAPLAASLGLSPPPTPEELFDIHKALLVSPQGRGEVPALASFLLSENLTGQRPPLASGGNSRTIYTHTSHTFRSGQPNTLTAALHSSADTTPIAGLVTAGSPFNTLKEVPQSVSPHFLQTPGQPLWMTNSSSGSALGSIYGGSGGAGSYSLRPTNVSHSNDPNTFEYASQQPSATLCTATPPTQGNSGFRQQLQSPYAFTPQRQISAFQSPLDSVRSTGVSTTGASHAPPSVPNLIQSDTLPRMDLVGRADAYQASEERFQKEYHCTGDSNNSGTSVHQLPTATLADTLPVAKPAPRPQRVVIPAPFPSVSSADTTPSTSLAATPATAQESAIAVVGALAGKKLKKRRPVREGDEPLYVCFEHNKLRKESFLARIEIPKLSPNLPKISEQPPTLPSLASPSAAAGAGEREVSSDSDEPPEVTVMYVCKEDSQCQMRRIYESKDLLQMIAQSVLEGNGANIGPSNGTRAHDSRAAIAAAAAEAAAKLVTPTQQRVNEEDETPDLTAVGDRKAQLWRRQLRVMFNVMSKPVNSTSPPPPYGAHSHTASPLSTKETTVSSGNNSGDGGPVETQVASAIGFLPAPLLPIDTISLGTTPLAGIPQQLLTADIAVPAAFGYAPPVFYYNPQSQRQSGQQGTSHQNLQASTAGFNQHEAAQRGVANFYNVPVPQSAHSPSLAAQDTALEDATSTAASNAQLVATISALLTRLPQEERRSFLGAAAASIPPTGGAPSGVAHGQTLSHSQSPTSTVPSPTTISHSDPSTLKSKYTQRITNYQGPEAGMPPHQHQVPMGDIEHGGSLPPHYNPLSHYPGMSSHTPSDDSLSLLSSKGFTSPTTTNAFRQPPAPHTLPTIVQPSNQQQHPITQQQQHQQQLQPQPHSYQRTFTPQALVQYASNNQQRSLQQPGGLNHPIHHMLHDQRGQPIVVPPQDLMAGSKNISLSNSQFGTPYLVNSAQNAVGNSDAWQALHNSVTINNTSASNSSSHTTNAAASWHYSPLPGPVSVRVGGATGKASTPTQAQYTGVPQGYTLQRQPAYGPPQPQPQAFSSQPFTPSVGSIHSPAMHSSGVHSRSESMSARAPGISPMVAQYNNSPHFVGVSNTSATNMSEPNTGFFLPKPTVGHLPAPLNSTELWRGAQPVQAVYYPPFHQQAQQAVGHQAANNSGTLQMGQLPDRQVHLDPSLFSFGGI